MWAYFKSNQSMLVLFKMFVSLIIVFVVSSLTFATVDAEKCTSSPRDQDANSCLLPPYPEHGMYTVNNYPYARPGERYRSVKLDVSCDTGYQNENNTNSVFCVNGYWSATMPTCASFCTLIDDLSVEYRCKLSDPGSLKVSRECESMVPSGTVVTPICRSPGYFSLEVLAKMHCSDGIWDYKPICKRACGTITQHRQLESTSSYHVELPWHALTYKNSSTASYLYHCSGSLISSNTIISAARCFLDVELKIVSASYFLVAVGKLYRPYNDLRDRNSQQSKVVDIKISSDYPGTPPDYIHKIVLLTVETSFIFHLSVRPVCIDFDFNLDKTQLADGNSGKAAGWGKVGNNSQASEVLTVVDVSYIKFEDCYDMAPTDYRSYILCSEEFCGGYTYSTFFCRGDSGAGLAFLEPTTQRYYLRGVLYLSLRKNTFCTIGNFLGSYLSIRNNENFIERHL